MKGKRKKIEMKKTRLQRLGIVDLETGKVLEERVLFIGQRKNIDKGYLKVFVAFLEDIVEDEEIAGKAIRLLLYMLKSLDYDSLTLKVIPSDVIRELKISRDTYHRWINTLIAKNILDKVDRYTYRLKPYTFVRGSSQRANVNEVNEVKKRDDEEYRKQRDRELREIRKKRKAEEENEKNLAVS